MTKTAKKAPRSLAERIESLREEVEAELERLAEKTRPKGELKPTAIAGVFELVGAIPAGGIRQGWMAKGGGNVFEAYLAAVAKEH